MLCMFLGSALAMAAHGSSPFNLTEQKAPRMIKVVLVNSCGYVIGQDHHRARLSDLEVDQIIELRKAGCTWRDIADKFGISKGQAHDYWSGRRRSQTATDQKRIHPAKRFRPTPATASDFD